MRTGGGTNVIHLPTMGEGGGGGEVTVAVAVAGTGTGAVMGSGSRVVRGARRVVRGAWFGTYDDAAVPQVPKEEATDPVDGDDTSVELLTQRFGDKVGDDHNG